MRETIALIGFGLMTACGAVEDYYFGGQPTIDNELRPIVDQFMADCVFYRGEGFCQDRFRYISSIRIKRATLMDGNEGVCITRKADGMRWIKISESVPEQLLNEVVYHELFHCVFQKREHTKRGIMSQGYVVDYDRLGTFQDEVDKAFRTYGQ